MSERTAAANAKLAELRATKGIHRISRAKALSLYYRDLAGVDSCVYPDKRAAIEEWKSGVATAKGKSLKAVVQEICFACVGGDTDPAPKLRVRDCSIDCPLRAIRPWQELNGRKAPSLAAKVQI